jgi:glycosyltransferase involved in cell wall biosynthesis
VSPAPAVSVVIPTHESGEFAVQAIRDVLAQTFQDFEVVVVDNGSTDGTERLVEAIGDARIRYHWQEDSGLPANSRNVGVGLARASTIAFLDADDRWYPEKLARVMEVFASRPEADLVCHGVRMTMDGREVGVRGYTPAPDDVYDALLYEGNMITTSAVTAKKESLVAASLFSERPELVTVEDYDLWLRMARGRCRLVLIADVLGEYLFHATQASGRRLMHYRNLWTVLDEQFTWLATRGRLRVRKAWRRAVRSRGGLIRDLLGRREWAAAAGRIALLPFESIELLLKYRSLDRG